MLYVFSVQCAYSVLFPAVVYFVVSETFVPFDAAVYHPANVYPFSVGSGSVPYVESNVTALLVVPAFPIVPSVAGLL